MKRSSLAFATTMLLAFAAGADIARYAKIIEKANIPPMD